MKTLEQSEREPIKDCVRAPMWLMTPCADRSELRGHRIPHRHQRSIFDCSLIDLASSNARLRTSAERMPSRTCS